MGGLFVFCVRLLLLLRGHLFFHPQQPMTSDFEGFSIPDFIHYIYFPILILEKEPVFSFLMFNAKQGNYLIQSTSLWYDMVLDWGLNLEPPTLDDSTLPLGYRGGGIITVKLHKFTYHTISICVPFQWGYISPENLWSIVGPVLVVLHTRVFLCHIRQFSCYLSPCCMLGQS